MKSSDGSPDLPRAEPGNFLWGGHYLKKILGAACKNVKKAKPQIEKALWEISVGSIANQSFPDCASACNALAIHIQDRGSVPVPHFPDPIKDMGLGPYQDQGKVTSIIYSTYLVHKYVHHVWT